MRQLYNSTVKEDARRFSTPLLFPPDYPEDNRQLVNKLLSELQPTVSMFLHSKTLLRWIREAAWAERILVTTPGQVLTVAQGMTMNLRIAERDKVKWTKLVFNLRALGIKPEPLEQVDAAGSRTWVVPVPDTEI